MLGFLKLWQLIHQSSNIEAVRAGFLRRWWSVVEVVECGGVWWSEEEE
jgi:hypothetical protein